jgi:ribosome recycling factor
MDEALELAKDGMDKALDRLRKGLTKVRAGRANPAMLDDVRVDSYGVSMPLNQVATVSVGDARLLVIKPYDRNTIPAIEKAINAANLGINPQSDGIVIRLAIPPLTEERRKGLVKQVKEHSEDAKVAIRQTPPRGQRAAQGAREGPRDLRGPAEEGPREGPGGPRRFIKQVDEITAKKEAEIMEV